MAENDNIYQTSLNEAEAGFSLTGTPPSASVEAAGITAESTAQDGNTEDLRVRAVAAKAAIDRFASAHGIDVEIFATTRVALEDLERGQVPSKEKIDEIRREIQVAEAKISDAQAKKDYEAMMGAVGTAIPGSIAAEFGQQSIGQGLTLNGWGTQADDTQNKTEEQQEPSVYPDVVLTLGSKQLFIPNMKNAMELVFDYGANDFSALRNDARAPKGAGQGQQQNQGQGAGPKGP
jgi:hypothetical protein